MPETHRGQSEVGSAAINITTRVVEGSPSLQEYVQRNVGAAAVLIDEFNFLGSEIVEGTSGQELALVEYEAENSGVFVHVLSIFAVERSEAVLAALTTAPDAFDEIRASVEPYLLTLRVTA